MQQKTHRTRVDLSHLLPAQFAAPEPSKFGYWRRFLIQEKTKNTENTKNNNISFKQLMHGWRSLHYMQQATHRTRVGFSPLLSLCMAEDILIISIFKSDWD